MRKIRLLTVMALVLAVGCVQSQVNTREESKEWSSGYARCNLKVIKGDTITWVNWQSTPQSIAVGTPLQGRQEGARAFLKDTQSGVTYNVDLGSERPGMFEKFFIPTRPDLSGYSKEVQQNIAAQVARLGMTKEEVYVAMGPPTNIVIHGGSDIRSRESSYEEILKSDTWIYARRRFGKNIGVAFSAQTGQVIRTEGIWR